MADPVESWTIARRETIQQLRMISEKILHYSKATKIARTAGGGAAATAGIGAGFCYFAAPFSFGWSIAPATLLTVVALAGAASSIAASFSNYFIEKGFIDRVQEALDKDRVSLHKLKEAVNRANEIAIDEVIEGTVNVGKTIPSYDMLTASVSCRLDVSEKVAANLLRLGQSACFKEDVTVVVSLPLDIASFVNDTADLAKGSDSDAARKVNELTERLQEELEDNMAKFKLSAL